MQPASAYLDEDGDEGRLTYGIGDGLNLPIGRRIQAMTEQHSSHFKTMVR